MPQVPERQVWDVLLGLERSNVCLTSTAFGFVHGPRVIEAKRTVRAAPNVSAVVIVLTVVFPTTLLANVVAAALGKREMPTARTGVWTIGHRRVHVARPRVGLEPCSALSE
jgi:hypothetical protein